MKRCFAAGIVGLFLVFGAVQTTLSEPATPEKEPTLGDVLKNGLLARRQVEYDFIDRVVKYVEMKKLPLSMVRTTFLWARKKRKYPFQYFERAIKIRAAEVGVKL